MLGLGLCSLDQRGEGPRRVWSWLFLAVRGVVIWMPPAAVVLRERLELFGVRFGWFPRWWLGGGGGCFCLCFEMPGVWLCRFLWSAGRVPICGAF